MREKCVYCGQPALRGEWWWFVRPVRCASCQQIFEEDLKNNFNPNRLKLLTDDPHSYINRVNVAPE
ncbi:hypothetical protein GCM10027275_50240 [Rhabdobacter roseus]|uniref:Uncharacterized protein n=1 Tax=Rhabdobacter roseus TaxID=1655419 RepID=A0A840TRX1_9BACT|nr:hypothetical protein [Rhabdobacter roseus]MBB5287096.1 hypothetical protein [Rhabdobacter roseus]